jgi:hypothetical protein
MTRRDDTNRTAEGDAAKRRLAAGIARSRRLIDQYRTRLLLLRRADRDRPGKGRLVPGRG